MAESFKPPAAATGLDVALAADTTETAGQHIEVDQGDDNDSALGDDM